MQHSVTLQVASCMTLKNTYFSKSPIDSSSVNIFRKIKSIVLIGFLCVLLLQGLVSLYHNS